MADRLDNPFHANLTRGPIAPMLARLTLPMIWGLFAIVGFNLADVYFVGKLGTAAQAAISFTFPVVVTFGSIALGLGSGAGSVIARAIGEGDRHKVRRLATDALILAVLVVGLFIGVGLLTIDPLFTALGAKPDALPDIRQYMRIWYLGMLFLVVPMVGNQVIRASGNTLIPGLIMTVAAVGNLILDPLLIFGLAGFPKLGLAGAAVATVAARATTLVASLAVLHFRLRMIDFSRPRLGEVFASWRQILHVGIPAAGTNVIGPVSMGVLTHFMAGFGTEAVAAFGVAFRIEQMCLIVLIGLSAGVGPFVGQNWGARQYGRVRTALRYSFGFCMIWGALTAALLGLAATPLVRLFNEDAQVVATASLYFLMIPVSYGALGVLIVCTTTFNSLGKPRPSILLNLARMFLLYVPLAYLGKRLFGVPGIFGAAGLANFTVGLAAYLWSRRLCRDDADVEATKYGTFVSTGVE